MTNPLINIESTVFIKKLYHAMTMRCLLSFSNKKYLKAFTKIFSSTQADAMKDKGVRVVW